MTLASEGVQFETRPGQVDLDWGFWDAQLQAIDAINSGEFDVVVFRGGYGSGKSVLGARQTIEKALAHPKSDNLILAQDSAKGGPTTYKVFFEQLPGEDTVPDEGGDPENSPLVDNYHRVDRRITLPNGAIIRLGSADKWNRYAGGEFNFIWCDEVAHYENTNLFKLNRMLISRQRTSGGPNVTLWTSTGNGYNEFYDFVELQETPDGDDLPTKLENIVADSRNNPFLDEKEKLTRQFEGTDSERQGLAGGFSAAEGRVYGQFSRPRHVIPESKALDLVGDERIYGYDAGWDHERVVVELGQTSYDQWVVTDLFYRRETTIEDVVDPENGQGWMQVNDKPTGPVYAEHEPEHIQKFHRAGFDAQNAIKNIDDGIDYVRGRLEVKDGRAGLLVADNCTPLIKEFLSYQEDDVGKSDAQDHALDALRYALYTHENEPAGGGITSSEHNLSEVF